MRVNRFFIVLMLAVMLINLAGCMDNSLTPPQNTSESSVSTQETASPAEIIFPLAERKTYRILVAQQMDLAALQKSAWYQELESMTNVEIQFLRLDDIVAGREDIHAFIGNYLTSDSIASAATDGFLLQLDALVTEEIMPNYTCLLTTKPHAKQFMTCLDGHIYTLAALDNSTYGAHVKSPLLVNTEWLKKAGLSDVNTIEKFEQYLKYVKENDVNGNGDPNDEIPFLICASSSVNAEANLQGILSWWGLPTTDDDGDYYCVVSGGKVELAPKTKPYQAAIEKVSQWYKEGYLWSGFFTGTSDNMRELMNTPTPVVGAVTNSAWDGNMEYVSAPVPDGYTPRILVSSDYYGQRDFIGITNICSEEDAKVLLAWMDVAVFCSESPFHEIEPVSDLENIRQIEAVIGENCCYQEIWICPYLTVEQSVDKDNIWPDARSVILDYEEKFIKGYLEINEENWTAYMRALYNTDAWDLIEILQEAYDVILAKQ